MNLCYSFHIALLNHNTFISSSPVSLCYWRICPFGFTTEHAHAHCRLSVADCLKEMNKMLIIQRQRNAMTMCVWSMQKNVMHYILCISLTSAEFDQFKAYKKKKNVLKAVSMQLLLMLMKLLALNCSTFASSEPNNWMLERVCVVVCVFYRSLAGVNPSMSSSPVIWAALPKVGGLISREKPGWAERPRDPEIIIWLYYCCALGQTLNLMSLHRDHF